MVETFPRHVLDYAYQRLLRPDQRVQMLKTRARWCFIQSFGNMRGCYCYFICLFSVLIISIATAVRHLARKPLEVRSMETQPKAIRNQKFNQAVIFPVVFRRTCSQTQAHMMSQLQAIKCISSVCRIPHVCLRARVTEQVHVNH